MSSTTIHWTHLHNWTSIDAYLDWMIYISFRTYTHTALSHLIIVHILTYIKSPKWIQLILRLYFLSLCVSILFLLFSPPDVRTTRKSVTEKIPTRGIFNDLANVQMLDYIAHMHNNWYAVGQWTLMALELILVNDVQSIIRFREPIEYTYWSLEIENTWQVFVNLILSSKPRWWWLIFSAVLHRIERWRKLNEDEQSALMQHLVLELLNLNNDLNINGWYIVKNLTQLKLNLDIIERFSIFD